MKTTMCANGPDMGRDATSVLPLRLGRYRILRDLGAGGMAVVLLAVDEVTGERVAIKTVPTDDPESHRTFLADESKTLDAIRHRNVVRKIGGDIEGPAPYIVLEYAQGDTLADRLAWGPLSFVETEARMLQLLDAIEAVHEAGYVHRDVKPSNVLLAADGRVVLIDFGLAAPVDGAGREQLAGFVFGTPNYMPPEQYESDGRCDQRSDLFSLGCMLYECLTGMRPFEGSETEEIMRQIDAGPPEPPSRYRSGVPPALDALILELLRKDPDARPSSIAEVRRRFREVFGPSNAVTRRMSTNSLLHRAG